VSFMTRAHSILFLHLLFTGAAGADCITFKEFLSKILRGNFQLLEIV